VFTPQLLNEASKPEVHSGSRDALVQYRRLVESASKYVDVQRRLTAIDSRLRQPNTRYSSLVDDLHGLESLLSSLDDESSLERQALPVLQVTCSLRMRSFIQLSPRASSDTVSCTFTYLTWQFIIFTIFTITTCIISYSLSISF